MKIGRATGQSQDVRSRRKNLNGTVGSRSRATEKMLGRYDFAHSRTQYTARLGYEKTGRDNQGKIR